MSVLHSMPGENARAGGWLPLSACRLIGDRDVKVPALSAEATAALADLVLSASTANAIYTAAEQTACWALRSGQATRSTSASFSSPPLWGGARQRPSPSASEGPPISDATTRLLPPYILSSQAQKHVTHNEALRLLDGLVQLSVLDRDLTASPGSPTDGDRYIVGSGATGDWVGWDLNVALWTDGAWLHLPPRTGWRAWVEDEGLLLVYDGAGWVGTTPTALQYLALLGLGTTADSANPFSAKLSSALWTAKTAAEAARAISSTP